MISCDGLADVSQGNASVKPDPMAAAWAPVEAGEAGVGVTFDDEHPATARIAAASATVRSIFTGSRLPLDCSARCGLDGAPFDRRPYGMRINYTRRPMRRPSAQAGAGPSALRRAGHAAPITDADVLPDGRVDPVSVRIAEDCVGVQLRHSGVVELLSRLVRKDDPDPRLSARFPELIGEVRIERDLNPQYRRVPAEDGLRRDERICPGRLEEPHFVPDRGWMNLHVYDLVARLNGHLQILEICGDHEMPIVLKRLGDIRHRKGTWIRSEEHT